MSLSEFTWFFIPRRLLLFFNLLLCKRIYPSNSCYGYFHIMFLYSLYNCRFFGCDFHFGFVFYAGPCEVGQGKDGEGGEGKGQNNCLHIKLLLKCLFRPIRYAFCSLHLQEGFQKISWH